MKAVVNATPLITLSITGHLDLLPHLFSQVVAPRSVYDVILLGQEINADWLIIDERLGRKIALAMGFQIKGTLGLFVVAYRLGLLTQVEIDQAIETLGNSSVRLNPRLVVWLRSQLND